MPKRGTDHIWQLVKYSYDLAIYAKCKCGYEYCCSTGRRNANGFYDPFSQEPSIFYPYCPYCGARKKWYTGEIEKIEVDI